MPKCHTCKGQYGGEELFKSINDDGELHCAGCLEKKRRKPMSEKKGKPVVSLQVYEHGQTEDGEDNYLIEASVKLGGLNVSFERTTDDIRRYFTERKDRDLNAINKELEALENKKKRHLKSVDKE